MKKLIYIAAGIILLTSIMPSFNITAQAQGVTLILASPEADAEKLSQAAQALELRLEAYGIDDFEISLFPDRNLLSVKLPDAREAEKIQPLLTATGRLEFCEVFTGADFAGLFRGQGEEAWRQWLAVDKFGDGAVLGKIEEASIPAFMAFVREQHGLLPNELAFAFGFPLDESGKRAVFALRYQKGMAPLLGNEAVASCRAGQEGDKGVRVMLEFNEAGRARWAQATRDNIGRPIAIVIDGLVYNAPKVVEEMQSGRCMITGDFSPEEGKLLAALLTAEELPIPLRILELKK